MKKTENTIIKSFGLEELLTKTKNLIEENSHSVLLSNAKINTEKKMEELFDQKIKISSECKFDDIFNEIISSYLGNDSKTPEINDCIKVFYEQYDIKCNALIEQNLDPIIEKESQIMTSDLKNIVTNVLLKYENVISIDQKGFNEEYKKKISELLFDFAHECGKIHLNNETKIIVENVIKIYLKKINNDYISSI